MKPFVWCNPIIYSLPESNFPIINSPVPIIAGINLSRVEFELRVKSLFIPADNYVFVFLDEPSNRRYMNSPNIAREFLPPSFNLDLKEELTAEYEMFRSVLISNGKNKIDMSFDQHVRIGFNFAVIMRKILDDHITIHFPKRPVYSDEKNKILDIEYLQTIIIKNNPLDEHFCHLFTKTQTFTHYADKYYSSIRR